jgi:predicted DNA-binding protein (MmcQ/YjbR family)
MMDRDAVNAFCRALPGADWSDSFGPGIDQWNVGGKLFAVIGAGAEGVSVKTPDVETAAMLIETGVGFRAPYFHRSWVLIPFRAPDEEICHRIRASYGLIRSKLPKKAQAGLSPFPEE